MSAFDCQIDVANNLSEVERQAVHSIPVRQSLKHEYYRLSCSLAGAGYNFAALTYLAFYLKMVKGQLADARMLFSLSDGS